MSLASWWASRWRRPTLGEAGERRAARFLRRQGCTILETRRRSRYGEIDVIAVDGKTVVFVEVKTRRRDDGIRPVEAVDARRQRRLVRAATAYLKAHGLLDCPARFDVVEVVWPAGARRPECRRHVDAFRAEGSGQFFR